MKGSYRCALLFLCLAGFGAIAFAQALAVGPEMQGAQTLPAGVPQDWWSQVQSNIQKEEYHITWQDEAVQPGGPAGYQAPNRAQGFRAAFTEDGIRLVPLVQEGPCWEWGLSLAALPADGSPQLAVGRSEKPGIYVSDDRIEFDRGWITEWYVNSSDGLEQGFTIPAPLPEAGSRKLEAGGAGTSEPRTPNSELHIDLRLTGTLRPVFAEDGQAVDFHDSGSVAVLHYAGLIVTDGAGERIPARFEGIQGGIRIVVEEPDPIYPVTVDPLATSASWTWTGTNVDDYFGFSLSTAGDFNGDGYADVVVGAYHFNSYMGVVYLFLGSASGLSDTPSSTAFGETMGSYFGVPVAPAGDVNGDGYGDVIVGAPSHNTNTGKAYLYLGSASPPASLTAAWSKAGEGTSNCFGASAAAAGDTNGDGYGDVIVGAHLYNSNTGRAYLFRGSSSGLSTTATSIRTGEGTDQYFGVPVAGAGDVDGDGYADVLVGAYRYGSYAGKAYLYRGSTSGLSSTASWTATGEAANDYFGWSMSTAGDVTGDGYADVIVGAYGNNSSNGRLYLYSGGSSGLSTPASWTTSGSGGMALGYSVASAGDINGDGYADIIAGAPSYSTNTGLIQVYYGAASGLPATASWSVTGEAGKASRFGRCVATAGDINGDGYSDVVVGAPNYNLTQNNQGRAYLYKGSVSGPATTAGWTAESDQAIALFGLSVASAGDVNGDGYGDIIVGAPYYDNGLTNQGRAFVFLGSAAGPGTASAWTAESNRESAYFGYSVGTAGDVNGDGYSDIIVGAYEYTASSYKGGRAFVYFGSTAGPGTTAAWWAQGDKDYASFGFSIGTAGDVNGDGYSDIIVGAPYYSNGQTSEGRAFVYLGSAAGPVASAGWTAEGDQSGARFGYSVGTAGDVNRDGYSDIIVGAPGFDNGETDEGRAFVYFGSASGPVAGWTQESNQAGAQFGFSVGTAGDVNGDGYSDIIVGAPYREFEQVDEGWVFVYRGPSLSDGTRWFTLGLQAGAHLGFSVGTAGDVNGDGYSDIIIGAPDYDNGQTDEGRAFIYLGSATGLSGSVTPQWTAESDQAGAFLGRSVGTAGDVNGDGYSDIIIGANNFDNGQTDEGRGFLYYGNGETGPGLSLRPRQRRADDAAPIDRLGWSESPSSFRLASLGRTPYGRTKVKLELEVKPLGTAFDGTGTVKTTNWTSTGTAGGELNQLITSLNFNTAYHWRARLLYQPASTPFQQKSRWFTQPWGGWGETDLRTLGPKEPSGLPNNTSTDLNACADEGVMVQWAADPSNWGDGGTGTRTYTVLRDGSILQAEIAYGTTDFTDTTGSNGTSYQYAVRYVNGCGLTAATAGAVAGDYVTPNTPANPTATDIDLCVLTGVSITWDPVPGATGYDLFIAPATFYAVTAPPYLHVPGDSATRTYYVRARNGSCEGEWSGAVNGADGVCPVPSVITPLMWAGMVLTWPQDSNATGYRVYRGTPAGLPNLLNTGTDFCTRYEGAARTLDASGDDPAGVAGQCYFYLATAYNGAGEGPAGNATLGPRQVNTTGVCTP